MDSAIEIGILVARKKAAAAKAKALDTIIAMRPLHPQGLRAFPPEVRKFIFEYAFTTPETETLYRIDGEHALLEALRSFESDLYEEALVVFYEKATATVTDPSRSGLKPYVSGGEMLKANMLLVKNLQIDLDEQCTELLRNRLLNWLKHFCSEFPNTQHLTLNFGKVTDQGKLRNTDFKRLVGNVVCPVYGFQHLRKVSLALQNRPKMGDTSDAWHGNPSMVGPSRKHERDMDSIQQALGINPKMDHVHTVTLGPINIRDTSPAGIQALISPNVVFSTNQQFVPVLLIAPSALETYFRPWTYHQDPMGEVPSTTWFWEAEQGKTLEWKEENIRWGWSGHIPWDAKPGETLVWNESLVMRGADGSIYF